MEIESPYHKYCKHDLRKKISPLKSLIAIRQVALSDPKLDPLKPLDTLKSLKSVGKFVQTALNERPQQRYKNFGEVYIYQGTLKRSASLQRPISPFVTQDFT